MTRPPPEVVAWVVDAAAPGAALASAADLRQAAGGGPWRLQLNAGSNRISAVVHVGGATEAGTTQRFRTHAAALELAAQNGLAAPGLLAADMDASATSHLAMVQTALAGNSRIPTTAEPFLSALGPHSTCRFESGRWPAWTGGGPTP
jgi:hypothetical protein